MTLKRAVGVETNHSENCLEGPNRGGGSSICGLKFSHFVEGGVRGSKDRKTAQKYAKKTANRIGFFPNTDAL